MISPTSADRLYLCRSSDSKMLTPCSNSRNVNTVTYKSRPRSSLTLSSSSTILVSPSRPQATATRPSSSSPAILSCATEIIPQSRATLTSIEALSACSERSSPASPIATSPVLKRRPSYTKRLQKSAHRAAIRRIISASHDSHIHHLEQHEQQQQSQLFRHSRSSAQSSPPCCCPSRRPLSLSTPFRPGSVTEAVLQDQQLPLSIHPSTSAPDPSLFCFPSSLSRVSRHDCLYSSRSRIRYQSTLLSPDKRHSQTTSNVPDTLSYSSPSSPSTSPSSHCPLAHTSSSSSPSAPSPPESFQKVADNVNNASVRRSCVLSSTVPRCHSFDSHRAILQGGREGSGGRQCPPLCSNLSTAELQSSVPIYPFPIQDLPANRPKIYTQGSAPDASIAQSGPRSAPPVLSSRPWTPLRLSLTLGQPTESSRDGRGTGRRHSDGEAVWVRITQNPKENFMARLRSASGSTSRSEVGVKLPCRKGSAAWPPVMAMVNQGLVAAKRSADLDLQYRESAKIFGQDTDGDGSGAKEYEGASSSASTTGTPPTMNPGSSYAMEIGNPALFEFDSFRMAPPNTTPHPTVISNIDRCDIHQIASSQQHRLPSQWEKQPRLRFKGRLRWQRVGEDYSPPSFQRRPSSARPLPSSKTTASLKMKDTESQQRQLSPRFSRHLEAKPLSVVRSISRATLRRRPSRRRSFKLLAVNTNKPLPPIPTSSHISTSDRGDLPKIKKCIGSPAFENDSYHEAISNMACHQDHGNCNRQGYYCNMKEEVTVATTTQQQFRHTIHDEHVCDGGDHRPMTDGSGEKDDSSSLQSFAPPNIDHTAKDNEDSSNQNSVPAHSTSDPTSGQPSTSTTAVLSASATPIAAATESSTVAVVTSAKRLESFRFPIRKSPIEKRTPARLRLHRHSHHQSLPYNTTHSRVLGKGLDIHLLSPSGLIQNSRSNSSSISSRATSPGLGVAVGTRKTGSSRMIRGHNIKDSNAITATDNDRTAAIPDALLATTTTVGGMCESGSERRSHRGHGPQRLKRSESCDYISYHRPSLSFNSSKKALLSLQDRRINKPDAKVRHRLTDIRTTAPATTTTAVISEGMAGIYSDDDFGTEDALPSSSRLTDIEPVLSSSGMLGALALGRTSQDENGGEIEVETVLRTAKVSCDDLADYHIQVSGKDHSRIEARLADGGYIQQVSQGRDVAGVSTNGPPEDLNSDAPLPPPNGASATKPAPEHESGLSSALETFTIDPNPVIDAGEIKRFAKRSHAFLELETTEESYVNDLDILVHVYLRILESRSWFPQIILAKMRRCVSGLLALHRDFHSRLEANKVDDSDREQQAPLKVYRDLAESFRVLDCDSSLYSTFCELRMRTVKEINRSAGQATMTLIQREVKELMAQQGRPSSRADLKDFLIKPIQRVCRYPLLLKEILRLTSEDDPEYQYIDQAYRLMKDKAREMDETQRAVERKLLTEQFLKKLPETSFPRKVGTITTSMTKEHSNAGGNGNSNNDSNTTNGGNHNAGQFTVHSSQHCAASPGYHYCGNSAGLKSSPGGMSDSHLDFGPVVQEGLAPAPLTKAFAGTLGSIVLAGALEYVITPDVPIRLKYYGCFLFETVLIVVKAKKSSLYEPRLWLPLRLCELQETTRLDGYTRFGWRIVYDQFRVEFGASCDAEQKVWVSNLQDRIQTAKDAYSKLPREIAVFETIISSLPWKLNNKSQTNCSGQGQEQVKSYSLRR